MDMISNSVSIILVDSPTDAPKYSESVGLLKIKKMIVVGKGATNGNPTVDLQLVDREGNEYVIMATCGIIENMGVAARAKREIDTTH